MNRVIASTSSLLFIAFIGTSCSTRRFVRERQANAAAVTPTIEMTSVPLKATPSVFTAVPVETTAPTLLAEAPQSQPHVAPASAPAPTRPQLTEPEKVVTLNKLPTSAVVASSPTKSEKAAAIEAEKAALAKKASATKITTGPFEPAPYFTLFTKTGEDAQDKKPAAETGEVEEKPAE